MTARLVLLVSGLSGAGKSSILRVLEDLGFEAVDNAPLAIIDEIARRGSRPLAIGVDARTTGFAACAVLQTLAGLRRHPGLRAELLFAVADEAILLRRYTTTRRRHPLAGDGGVPDGIAAEAALTAVLRANADLVIDTSDLLPAELRRLVERRYVSVSVSGDVDNEGALTVSLVSFAFPAGLPRDSDMVLDARFLRNPFYDPILCDRTGQDPAVVAHIARDPAYRPFLDRIDDLLRMVFPRFVAEGKKYTTVSIGCSGGRHRSVALVEALAAQLGSRGDGSRCRDCLHDVRYPIIVMHRELSRARGAA